MKNHLGYKRAKTGDLRQKLRFCICFLCLIFCVSAANSCSRGQRDPLSYRASPYRARITATGFDTDFEAIAEFTPSADGSGDRYVFEFLSPLSLEGMSAKISGGRVEIWLNGQMFAQTELAEIPKSGIFRVIEMLSPGESIKGIKSTSGKECGLPQYEKLTAVSTASFVIYIDPLSGFPVKVSTHSGGQSLTINLIVPED